MNVSVPDHLINVGWQIMAWFNETKRSFCEIYSVNITVLKQLITHNKYMVYLIIHK